MNNISIYALCRICLKDSHSYANIYQSQLMGEYLYENINDVCELDISLGDGLPEFLCSECLLKINEFKLFKKHAHDGRTSLMLLKEKTKNVMIFKKEPVFYESSSFIADNGSGGMWNGAESQENASNDEGSDNFAEKSLENEANIKQEEDFDGSSADPGNASVVQRIDGENQVNCGPILLKHEVLPFRMDSDTQAGDVPSERCEPASSTTTLRSVRPARKELENQLEERHVGKPREEKRFQCSECGWSFDYMSEFAQHQRRHTGERPFECHECGKRFSQKGNLLTHSRLHSGYKPYRCYLCGKQFIQKGNLSIHMKSHSGLKPFHCPSCGKRFNHKGNLNAHLRTHVEERPFSCEECGRSFKQKALLVQHTRIHTGEMPFQCGVCKKRFRQESNYVKHRRVHAGTAAIGRMRGRGCSRRTGEKEASSERLDFGNG